MGTHGGKNKLFIFHRCSSRKSPSFLASLPARACPCSLASSACRSVERRAGGKGRPWEALSGARGHHDKVLGITKKLDFKLGGRIEEKLVTKGHRWLSYT